MDCYYLFTNNFFTWYRFYGTAAGMLVTWLRTWTCAETSGLTWVLGTVWAAIVFWSQTGAAATRSRPPECPQKKTTKLGINFSFFFYFNETFVLLLSVLIFLTLASILFCAFLLIPNVSRVDNLPLTEWLIIRFLLSALGHHLNFILLFLLTFTPLWLLFITWLLRSFTDIIYRFINVTVGNFCKIM